MTGLIQYAAKFCRLFQISVLLLMTLFAGLASAPAHELMADKNTCASDDCNATIIPGYINGWTAGGNLNVSAFVIQVFAAKNECLRLRVIEQGDLDTEMVVISADANAYRNDKSNEAPCKTCPLVKFVTGGTGGWHTVHVSQRSGQAVSGPIKLAYGRYSKSNPNCHSPTAPLP